MYVDPPANVVVVSIDEKTGIQAKAPTKPDAPPAQGRPARREHEYTRNGTQCLFAALKVHRGDVLAMASKTRNRFDLIRFLDMLDAEIAVVDGQQIVAISDNLSTRGTQEVQDWLEAHPRWSFQFTPTHASWLNQIEISSRSSRAGCSSTASSPARATSSSRCSPTSRRTTRPPGRSSGPTPERPSKHESTNSQDEPLAPDERVAVLEQRVATVEASAARIVESVDKLSEAVSERRVTDAAAHAMTTTSLTALQRSVGHMRAEINGKRWPPAALATVAAAGLGALAVVIAPILPA